MGRFVARISILNRLIGGFGSVEFLVHGMRVRRLEYLDERIAAGIRHDCSHEGRILLFEKDLVWRDGLFVVVKRFLELVCEASGITAFVTKLIPHPESLYDRLGRSLSVEFLEGGKGLEGHIVRRNRRFDIGVYADIEVIHDSGTSDDPSALILLKTALELVVDLIQGFLNFAEIRYSRSIDFFLRSIEFGNLRSSHLPKVVFALNDVIIYRDKERLSRRTYKT